MHRGGSAPTRPARHSGSRVITEARRRRRGVKWVALTLGVVAALAIAIWRAAPTSTNSSADRSAAVAPPGVVVPVVPDVPGVLHPSTNPDFSATFAGSSLNTSIWATCYPWFQSTGCTNFGNPRKELEWYLPTQVHVSGGLLRLVAQREATAGQSASGAAKTYACRSGIVTTYPGYQFQYGYIQIVARIPTGAGLWPALWLAAADQNWPPEMDILEAWGSPRFSASATLHYATPTGSSQVQGNITPAARAAGWHTFGLSWTSSQLTWVLDGRAILTVRQHVPHQKMYFIADLAESISAANPAVTPGECNGSLLIRSVKVWKP